jgi:hypothetical protein
MFTGPNSTGVELTLFSVVNTMDYYYNLDLNVREEEGTKIHILPTLNFSDIT